MKNIFLILLFILPINMYSLWIYAYNDINNSSYERNTDLNIKWSKLIKKYLYSLLNNLNSLKIKYKLESNNEIKNYTKTLESMIRLLSRIQNNDIEKQKAENIMRVIIKELKPLNKKIKLLLKNEQRKQKVKTDNLKQKYYNLSSKLSITLDKIIISFYLPIKDKKQLNEKEVILLSNLKTLKINSDFLKNIEKRDLNSIFEVKKELLNIIKKIKKSLLIIKNI